MTTSLPQVGAPDPELNTSPIIDESEFDERAGARDLELEEPACYFNGETFPIGTYVQSGSEVLLCNGRGSGAARVRSVPDSALDENQQIAFRLREAAALLDAQGASPFRVAAYRRAADVVARSQRPLREVFDAEGRAGLQALPGIGAGISSAIAEILITGRWNQLERLRGGAEPEALLRAVPGIGTELARAIHDELHVDTLEALEIAAHDGRLEALRAVGPRRAAAIRASLAAMLGRGRRAAGASVDVALLLEVDREYRDKAAAGKLPLIAPRRFNPGRKAWLPVLHTQRGTWHFTALFSNTARAHELQRTRDWVVIYFYDGDHREGQCTVVTQARGPAAGERVVRGREEECLSSIGG